MSVHSVKIRKLVIMGVALILLRAVSPCAAQSLGQIARQEREKRGKEAKKPPKEFTNDNMPRRPRGEGPTAAASISEAPAAGAPARLETAQAPTETGAAVPSSETKPPEPEPEEKKKDEKPEDKVKTNDYWQGRFKSVRARLAKAEEEQQLVEDELNLLRVQQAREIAPEVQKELQQKIADKTAELETKRAASEKVKKALDELEEEFKKSGAPEEWSKAE